MTYKELLEKAAHRFRLIADDTNRITSGNLSHNLTCLRGFALRAAESIEKHLQEEPVSEDLKEASKEWLRPQLDKSYAYYGEGKMMELTHFDGYAMLDAIEFGAKLKEQQMMKSSKLSGWVARDEDGSLHLFEVEPRRIEDRHQWWDRDYNCTALEKSEFPDLKWEDEPVYVKLPIIVEDQL